MALTQQTFAGASISSFNVGMGWGDTPSTIRIVLVEDVSNGDNFVAPDTGSPALFVYDTFAFAGIVASYRQLEDFGGFPTFEVSLKDPREILSGVGLILNKFNGSTNNVPNLFNVFGYWEDRDGFGGSEVNSAGIPWKKVRDAVVDLTNGANATYGGSIVVRNSSYAVNLDNLPNLPDFYRIGSDDTNLMDFIREVCDSANYDFFFSMSVGATNTIILETINKNVAPVFGAIQSFIDSTSGAVRKDSGREFRDEITSKFVVGGNVESLFLQTLNGGDDDDFDTIEEDNTIWPYWGLDIDGNAIIGEGLDDYHSFELDSRWIDVAGVEDTYPTNVLELRAAQDSRETWENVLSMNDSNYYQSISQKDIKEALENNPAVQESIRGYHQELRGILVNTNGKLTVSADNPLIVQIKTLLRPGVFDISYVEVVGGLIQHKAFLERKRRAELTKLKTLSIDDIYVYEEIDNYYRDAIAIVQSDIDDINDNIVEAYASINVCVDYRRDPAKPDEAANGYKLAPAGCPTPPRKWKPILDKYNRPITYYHNTKINPLFGRATALRIGGFFTEQVFGRIQEYTGLLNKVTPGQFLNIINNNAVDKNGKRFLNTDEQNKIGGDGESEFEKDLIFREDNIAKIYEYVKSFADEYYGRKFMVRLPFILSATDEQSGEIRLSKQPTNAGFLEEDVYDDAAAANIAPPLLTKVSTPEGKVYPYVRYRNADRLDFDEISEDAIIWNKQLNTAYVRCDVEEFVVYVDATTGYSPRAIILLPGVVRKKSQNYSNNMIVNIIRQAALEQGTDMLNHIGAIMSEIANKVGSDNTLAFNLAALSAIPDLAVVPMVSNVLRYGPWYASGANGALSYEQDDSLVPWSFGGYEAMNNAAEAKVLSALSDYQVSEAGSIEFPGAPGLSIGAPLIAGGPYITNISVQVTNEVTTSYDMTTWSPRPFRLSKHKSDFIQRLSIRNNQIKRNFRSFVESINTKPQFPERFRAKSQSKSPRSKLNSSHGIIIAENVLADGTSEDVEYSRNDIEQYETIVSIQPFYNTSEQIGQNVGRQGAMSLDGLFRPYSTNPNAQGIAHFETPTSDSGTVTVTQLNPFGVAPSPSMALTGRDERPSTLLLDDIDIDDDTEFKGIALAGPLILSGPGYNTQGKPVPNASGDGVNAISDFFEAGYKNKPHRFKTGPLDTRWDDERKVWVAGGTNTKLVKILEAPSGFSTVSSGFPTGPNRHVFYAEEYEVSFDDSEGATATVSANGNHLYVANFRRNVPLSGMLYTAFSISGKYILDNQASFLELM